MSRFRRMGRIDDDGDDGATVLLDFSLVTPGGSQTYAEGFLAALSYREDLADVTVLASDRLHEISHVLDRLREQGASVVPSGAGSGLIAALTRQLLVPYQARRLDATAVFVPRDTGPVMTPTSLVLLSRSLAVWSSVGAANVKTRAKWLARRGLAWLAMRRATRIAAVSAVMANALPTPFRSRLVVIHHGCDLMEVPKSRLESGPAPELWVVALGTVSPHKRYDLIINQVAALRALGQPARLEIWGSRPDRDCAEAISRHGVERLGSSPLRGPLAPSDRQQVLADADVLAVGSSFESFCLPLVEGMRTSCLVWAPASSIVEELCDDVAVSFPESAADLAAQALLSALPDASERLSHGRERARAFTWDATVDRTLSLVRSARRLRIEHEP